MEKEHTPITVADPSRRVDGPRPSTPSGPSVTHRLPPIDGRPWDDDSVEVAWVARRAGHVAKAVKGVLIALAAALALEISSDAGAAALGLLGTVIAVMFANAYADWLQAEIERGRRLGLADLRHVAGRSLGVAAGALPAFLLFVAAWLGWLTVEATIDLAIWIGIGLLFVFGYVGGRLRGDQQAAALMHGEGLDHCAVRERDSWGSRRRWLSAQHPTKAVDQSRPNPA